MPELYDIEPGSPLDQSFREGLEDAASWAAKEGQLPDYIQRRSQRVAQAAMRNGKITPTHSGEAYECGFYAWMEGQRAPVPASVSRPMLTATEYAELHGTSADTVQRWCREHLLLGAYQSPPRPRGTWLVPASSPPPQLKPGPVPRRAEDEIK